MRERIHRELALALCALSLPIASAQVDADELDSARALLEQWVETRQVIAEEREDWRFGKELLTSRIELVEGEIAAVEERTAQAREKLSEATRKRRDLRRRGSELEAGTATLARSVAELEASTLRLVPMAPLPLRERISLLSRRIPPPGTKTELGLGQRYQNVIGALNEIGRFNRDVAVTSEVRPLPDGTHAEVRTLYVGLGQAYYVDTNATAAGVGHPTADGWQWTEDDEIAAGVARAIAILQNEDVPAYVPLPVILR